MKTNAETLLDEIGTEWSHARAERILGSAEYEMDETEIRRFHFLAFFGVAMPDGSVIVGLSINGREEFRTSPKWEAF
jgi:hypothetical protein